RLRDERGPVRYDAVEAIAAPGLPLPPDLLEHLADLAYGPDAAVRRAAVDALLARRRGDLLAGLLNGLPLGMASADPEERRKAAEAIGSLGNAAATAPALAGLARL